MKVKNRQTIYNSKNLGERTVKEYRIILVKDYGDRPDVSPDRRRQNLVMTLRVRKFKSRTDFSEFSKMKLKKRLKEELKKAERKDINQKYPVEKKEEFMLVEDHDLSNPLFRDQITVPTHLRRDKDEVISGSG